MEVNVQLGEFTLKKHQMQVLPRELCYHTDFRAVFPNIETVQCAEVRNTEFRLWWRLVGSRHDIQYWPRADSRVPWNKGFSRSYDDISGGLGASTKSGESWIRQVLPCTMLFGCLALNSL